MHFANAQAALYAFGLLQVLVKHPRPGSRWRDTPRAPGRPYGWSQTGRLGLAAHRRPGQAYDLRP